jgi:hypothetical protein
MAEGYRAGYGFIMPDPNPAVLQAQSGTDASMALWVFAAFVLAAAVSAFLQRPRD